MKLSQLFMERPSVLPAEAAFRVHSLVPASRFAMARVDRASDGPLAVAPPTGPGGAVGTALHGVELLVPIPAAAEGCSVPTATPAPAQRKQTQTVTTKQTVPTKQTVKVTTNQIDVVPAYRRNAVGGAPPRGRPN